MARGGGLCRGELGGLEVLHLVGRKDHVKSCGAPFDLDSRHKLVLKNVVRKVSFRGRGVGVRGEVHEEHPVLMYVLHRRHVLVALGEDCWSPSRAAEIPSSSVVLVTEAKNALATVMEYSKAFAEYLEAARVLVTGSSMGKYAGLFDANLDGDLLSKPSAMMSRYML